MKTLLLVLICAASCHGAASFNSANSNCFIGPVSGNILNSTNSVSISFYRSLVGGGDVYYFLSKGDPNSNQETLYQDQNSVAFQYYSVAQGALYQRSGGSPVVGDGTLFNITLSYVYGVSNIAVFTNGVLQQGKLWTTVPNVLPASGNTKPLRLGSRQGTISGQYYRGDVTGLAIWNTNLNDIEMRTVSMAGVNGMALRIRPGSLVAYWGFDTHITGTSISIERDRSGNRNDLTNEITGPTQSGERRLSYPPNE